ncbi:MAG: DUF3800 domain-containing protein [Dehalococcoidia bacterium]|nr:DUF3800 domain-containing protein [Dehalococcoidia bacterium]
MYLLYVDESDSADHFVVGGVAIHEHDVWRLSEAVERFCSSLPESVRLGELHADHIRSGKKRWRHLPKTERMQVAHELADLLITFRGESNRQPVLFGSCVQKSWSYADPAERAFEDFFARCNNFLGRIAAQGDRHRCVVIADKSKLEARLQELMEGWRAVGAASTGSGPMASYAEVPLFVDSEASRLIQMADFVTHWMHRAYIWDDQAILSRIVSMFDNHNGVVHGLSHLHRNRFTCTCIGCTTRRPGRLPRAAM